MSVVTYSATVIEGELAARFITIPKSSWTEEVQGLLSQACRDLVKADQAMQQFGRCSLVL